LYDDNDDDDSIIDEVYPEDDVERKECKLDAGVATATAAALAQAKASTPAQTHCYPRFPTSTSASAEHTRNVTEKSLIYTAE